MPTTNATDLLERLAAALGGPEDFDEPLVLDQLIFLVVARDADQRKARAAMKRLQNDYVDWNEVRVSGVYEIRQSIAPIGQRRLPGRAETIKGLLTTAYERFNKLELEDLRPGACEGGRNRQRERFAAWLHEQSPALAMALCQILASDGEICIDPGLPRVLDRLGLLGGSATLTAARKKLPALLEGRHVGPDLWRLHLLMEHWCHAKDPRCTDCPLLEQCPTGTANVHKAAKKSAKKSTAKKAAKKTAAKKTSTKKTAKKATKKAAKKKAAKKAAKKAGRRSGTTGS